MFVLFFFIPYFHPLFSCFSSGLQFLLRLRKNLLLQKDEFCFNYS
ncbi:hypothetical protein [Wolbachia pipientis]|nr:hypothetical protein [Wolbachia pipientis]